MVVIVNNKTNSFPHGSQRCFITVAAYLFEYHPFSLNCVNSEIGYGTQCLVLMWCIVK